MLWVYGTFFLKKRNFDTLIQASLMRITNGSASPSIEQFPPSVREFLVKTMEKLKEDHPWRRNMQYELCVACTSCSQGKCETQKVTDCTDDCIHFIKVCDGNPVCEKALGKKAKPAIRGIHHWFPSTKPTNKVMANSSNLSLWSVHDSIICLVSCKVCTSNTIISSWYEC